MIRNITFLSYLALILLLWSCHSQGNTPQSSNAEGQNKRTTTEADLSKSLTPAELKYLKKGKEIALTTKKALGKNLIGQLSSNGATAALSFCNLKAFPITDSMKMALRADISRKTDKPRNPGNRAQGEESDYIRAMKEQLSKGKQPSPVIKEVNGKMVGYYPIITNKMCLQCHGSPVKDIKPGTLERIKELYPQDKATGYSANQLRGIWVIEMNKEE